MPVDFNNLSSQFVIYGQLVATEPYGSGHINDTYAVTFNQGGVHVRYIFQRINHLIFTNPEKLMENIERVTEHICGKLQESGCKDISRHVMTLIPTHDGKSWYKDADGNYWRVYIFIENAKTYDTLDSNDQAYQAARAFGAFQKMLVDLPGGPLFEIIPDFHNGMKRYEAFEKAFKADVADRAKLAETEVTFLKENAWVFEVLPKLVESGDIPIRTTHNDTKINNVMLDDVTGEGVCVIDLDTIMPGLALYDFGDMVRTSTSPAAEDEMDLSKVGMLPDRFEALVRGYMDTAGDFLNQAEIDHLVFAGKLITLIIGTRFLTDYLAGDVYFKTHREHHNLDRARTQIKLVQSITEQEDDMKALVARIAK